ncbi:MAG: hypothetical protein ACE5EI_02700 [Thermodesulfobacteriota bacterium]
MKRSLLKKYLITPLAALAFLSVVAGPLLAADKKPAEPKVEYDARAAKKSPLVNPHEQISDEGVILWESCLVCHANLPDITVEKTIKDAKLRFAEDLDMLCRNCHVVKPHPAVEGVGPAMMQMKAPDHLVKPSRDIVLNIRLSMKEVQTVLPLDPSTGKILCVTCHNPHERGLVRGRHDTGADTFARLRTPGLDICQYCHRK